MIKLSIKTLEKKLSKYIRKNTKVIGVDTAPNKTGWAIMETDDKWLRIDCNTIKLDSKDRYFKYDKIIELFKDVVKKGYEILVEDAYYGFNANGFKMLSRVGMAVYTLAYLKKCKRDFRYATTARALLGIKKRKKSEVHEEFKKKINLKITDEDALDAIILGFSGLVEEAHLEL